MISSAHALRSPEHPTAKEGAGRLLAGLISCRTSIYLTESIVIIFYYNFT